MEICHSPSTFYLCALLLLCRTLLPNSQVISSWWRLMESNRHKCSNRHEHTVSSLRAQCSTCDTIVIDKVTVYGNSEKHLCIATDFRFFTIPGNINTHMQISPNTIKKSHVSNSKTYTSTKKSTLNTNTIMNSQVLMSLSLN